MSRAFSKIWIIVIITILYFLGLWKAPQIWSENEVRILLLIWWSILSVGIYFWVVYFVKKLFRIGGSWKNQGFKLSWEGFSSEEKGLLIGLIFITIFRLIPLLFSRYFGLLIFSSPFDLSGLITLFPNLYQAIPISEELPSFYIPVSYSMNFLIYISWPVLIGRIKDIQKQSTRRLFLSIFSIITTVVFLYWVTLTFFAAAEYGYWGIAIFSSIAFLIINILLLRFL